MKDDRERERARKKMLERAEEAKDDRAGEVKDARESGDVRNSSKMIQSPLG